MNSMLVDPTQLDYLALFGDPTHDDLVRPNVEYGKIIQRSLVIYSSNPASVDSSHNSTIWPN